MPQELLHFPTSYCVVGAYRLLSDKKLWQPLWENCRRAAQKSAVVAAAWGLITWPIQKRFVRYFMKGAASVTGFAGLYGKLTNEAASLQSATSIRLPLPSLTTLAAFIFILGQCSTIIELWMNKALRAARKKAYEETVKSRGKEREFWGPYAEEWAQPPTAKAIKNSEKANFYLKLANPLVRIFLLKVLLLPLDFVPFLGLTVSAALRSLTMARVLHQPYFAAKGMTPQQVELFITERQWPYRAFGFVAALLEHIPIVGIVFSISNRIGAAMWAHDLEKRQARFRAGQVKPLPPSETYSYSNPFRPSSPTSSQAGKLPFAEQPEPGFAIPGGMMPSSSAPTGASISAGVSPSVSNSGRQGPPPPYNSAAEGIEDSAGPSGTLGLGPQSAGLGAGGDGQARHRVPPKWQEKR